MEHLVIIPRQKAHGFDGTPRWNQKLKERFRTEFWKAAPNPEDRRSALLRAYVTVKFLVTDKSVHGAADRVLSDERLLAEAQSFASAMREALGSKERMASAAVRFQIVPPGIAQLLLFDVLIEQEIPSIIAV